MIVSSPGMELWLVALVLGSSIVLRKEPSGLLGSVLNSGRAVCEHLNRLRNFTHSQLPHPAHMTGCWQQMELLAPII